MIERLKGRPEKCGDEAISDLKFEISDFLNCGAVEDGGPGASRNRRLGRTTNEQLHWISFALVTGDVVDGGVYLLQPELAWGDPHAVKQRRDGRLNGSR